MPRGREGVCGDLGNLGGGGLNLGFLGGRNVNGDVSDFDAVVLWNRFGGFPKLKFWASHHGAFLCQFFVLRFQVFFPWNFGVPRDMWLNLT